jgi:hypothetical protein
MSESERELALRILKDHWHRSFFQAKNIEGYIKSVTKQLRKAGIKGKIPQKPEKFLEFCRSIGLFKGKT